ncbi:mitogen-activated protein kinase kinase kinase 15 [Striga asiatica]|uniref:Mitogen-activated protein kinase kinase kinase 15 n=1 Tax=Striga asiatica TaxID=4170 RepID=A0A5A7RDB1_STRAF|nr:mitogen-activated protein kinase kinase kinase 15 [Striga asiatica]
MVTEVEIEVLLRPELRKQGLGPAGGPGYQIAIIRGQEAIPNGVVLGGDAEVGRDRRQPAGVLRACERKGVGNAVLRQRVYVTAALHRHFRRSSQNRHTDNMAIGGAVYIMVVEMGTGFGPWPEMKDSAAAIYKIAFFGDLPETPNFGI